MAEYWINGHFMVTALAVIILKPKTNLCRFERLSHLDYKIPQSGYM